MGPPAEMRPANLNRVMPAEEETMKHAILAAVAAAIATANAGLEMSGYGSFDVTSAYVLYGARFNKDPSYWTYGEINATADGWGGPGIALWQNSDITCRRKDTLRRMNEWDWTAYYRYGYDRMRGGFAHSGEFGYMYMSNSRILNFSLSFEFTEAFTK